MLEILGIKYVTDKEASYQYGYSQSWFQKMRAEGHGPEYVRLNGKGKILYPADKLEQWFRENLIKDV